MQTILPTSSLAVCAESGRKKPEVEMISGFTICPHWLSEDREQRIDVVEAAIHIVVEALIRRRNALW